MPSTVRLETSGVRAEVRRKRFRLKVRDQATRKRLVREQRDGLFWERGGVTHGLAAVTGVTTLPDAVVLTVDTDEGVPATVTLRFLTRRTLEVALDPPVPETIEAVGERLASSKREAIYGLTERLRDSPPIAPGVVDIPQDDVNPPEVGTLDRRGERIEMRVLPTFSLYAPFFQSSNGYGLAVDGTTVGVFDVAQSDPGTVSFRFEAGSTPDSRRLVYRVFAGPDHGTILDEYTALTGRPIVPPDWAFLHWRWRGEPAPRRSTATPSTRRSPTTCSCTRRSAFRRACICSTGPCSSATSASRAGSGTPPACRIRTRCSSRSATAATAS